MKLKFYFLTCLVFLTTATDSVAQSEDVQVMIATGIEFSQASAISPDKRYVAQALYNSLSIWDVKTGRLIRIARYSNNATQTADTIWFSKDAQKIICKLPVSNDTYEVDIESGEFDYVKGPPMDYTTYKYVMSNRIKSANYLVSGNKEPLAFSSPDGQSEVVYKVIKNPLSNHKLMPYVFETYVRIDGKLSPPLDTVFQASFVFSEDSEVLFAEDLIIDMRSGRLISKLKMVQNSGRSVMFLAHSHIPVTSGIQSIRIWDFPDVVDVPVKNAINFYPSADKSKVICEQYSMLQGYREFVQVDLKKKKIIGKPIRTQENAQLLDVAEDGDHYTFLEMIKESVGSMRVNYKVNVCQASTGKILKVIHGSNKGMFTADPNIMIFDSLGSKNYRLNLKTGEQQFLADDRRHPIDAAYQNSRDHKYVLGSVTLNSADKTKVRSTVSVYDVLTGEEVFQTEQDGIAFQAFAVSKDEKWVSFSSDDGDKVYVYNFKTAELHCELEGHSNRVLTAAFSDDGTRLLTFGTDGTRRLWNLEDCHEMVSLVNTGSDDFAIVTPQEYYYATKGAKKLIHFVKGVEIFPFSQFDLKYNRPDIIIRDMEASNQNLIQPFYYAYQKRLKRMGFTEEMLDGTFHLPTANITNKTEIPITTKDNKIKLQISANDNINNLDRLLIRVNEVPVHGREGISFRRSVRRSYEDDVEIELSTGHNIIQVSVLNDKGVESISSTVFVDYVPEDKTKPTFYLYTIGVSEYEQSDFNLSYAAKDAQDLQQLFGTDQIPFGNLVSKSLTNEEVTLENVQAIKEDLKSTAVDDAVCIFFAGHGILDVNLDYFLAAHNTNFKQPNEGGIPYEVFEDLLDNIPARKKLIMIDACHSGEIDKEEVAMIEEEAEQEVEEDISFRSVNTSNLKQIGLNNSFELMKELFTDVRKASGTVIISSAGGLEYAMEGGEWNNGVFTYSFINGIKSGEADLNEDDKVMLSEMNEFVREEVYRLTGGKQQPTNRAEVIEQDWQLW